MPYRAPKDRRRIGRERSRRRFRAHRDAGLCTRCGHRPPVRGGATCQICHDARQAAEREQYAARRAAGRCGRCGETAFDHASRCGPCAALEGRASSTEERGQPKALRPQAREVALHRLRRALAGSGTVRAVRAPVLGALGPASGSSDPSPALHRDRGRHGRGPRDLGQLGGGGHVPGLCQALPGGSRDYYGRLAHDDAHRMVIDV